MFDDSTHESVRGDGTSTITSANPMGLSFTGGSSGDQLNFSSNVQFNVWDFEATKCWVCGNLQVLGAAGVRYVHMSQDYSASLRPGPKSGSTKTDIVFGHNFNGAGPTIAFDSKYRIRESGLALYGKARGAILFGTAKEHLVFSTPTTIHDRSARQADVMPVGELEVGGEFSHELGRALGFVQLGFVGQAWWGAGNAANSYPHDSTNLGLVGLVLRGGINF
jgi:hypothetical protein